MAKAVVRSKGKKQVLQVGKKEIPVNLDTALAIKETLNFYIYGAKNREVRVQDGNVTNL